MYLAIDTSTATAGLALIENRRIVAENSWLLYQEPLS